MKTNFKVGFREFYLGIALASALTIMMGCAPFEGGIGGGGSVRAGRAAATVVEAAQAGERGLSVERLERIDQVMQANVEAGLMPGAVGLVWHDGEIAYFKGFGFEDIEKEEPMQPDTIFRVYSMTKPITSVAVMMLHEEGKFLLSDPVGKYLPELADLQVAAAEQDESREGIETVPAARPITIHDLLRHTSGLTYGFFGESPVDQAYVDSGVLVTEPTIQETVEKLGRLPLQYEPGTRWHYSVSTDVLGRLIEVVSGKPLDRFFEERIFQPLGMEDTAFWTGEEKADRLAELYQVNEEGELIENTEQRIRSFVEPTTHFSGGGGLVSTAEDYLRFARMLLNGGELDGTRLLSPRTVALMRSDSLGGLDGGDIGDGRSFGLGFGIVNDPGAVAMPGSVGEYGWGGLAGTRFWIDPEAELIGIFMTQVLPPRPVEYASQFEALVEQAIVD